MSTVRAYSPADAELVSAILMGTFTTTWAPQMTQQARDSAGYAEKVRGYIEAMGHEFVVLDSGGQFAGMIHWQDDFIHALHIHPDHHGQGHGGTLLAHAEQQIQAAGHPKARLETHSFNTRSRAFYEKHGYTEKDRYPDTQWDSGFTTILFEKTLA